MIVSVRGGSNEGAEGHVPPKPKYFLTNNTTSPCTILQVYGHNNNVIFQKTRFIRPILFRDLKRGSLRIKIPQIAQH